MPTYEYKCTQDGSTFELWQEVGSEAPPCPTCGSPSKKVFSPVRTIFKGSGFYLTDTRAEQAAKTGKSSRDSNAPTTSDSTSQPAESAPAAPATPATPAGSTSV